MPWKKVPCPVCGKNLIDKRSKACLHCSVPYKRTQNHRQHLSDIQKGRKHHWKSGSNRQEVAQKIREWWTPERKEAKRQEMLLRNPEALYHGLSCKGAKRLRDALGHCEHCGHDGSESHLDVHHRNGNKKDQSLDNLIVLCHRCHMFQHRHEIGWEKYHERIRLLKNS